MYKSRWAPSPPPAPEEKPTASTDSAPPHASDAAKTESDPNSSALSAETPSFAPAPVQEVPLPPDVSSYEDLPLPPEVSSYDSFAQTGGDEDDLFDDVAPADASMRVRSDDDLFSDDFTPAEQPIVEQAAPVPVRGRGEGRRSRGRARTRGTAGVERGNTASHTPTAPDSEQVSTQASEDTNGTAPDTAPTGPRKETVPAVRGDRHATGGVRKPKLTEEELAEKMAKIQIKNATLTASHARAEADAASFAEREQQAKQISAQRQKEERRDRQQMMGERERNRMRKLKAMEGREWDAEKNEDDFTKGGKFDKKGGFAGDAQDYTDGREYLYQEPRGGSRGRGGAKASRGRASQAPTKEDFPALPATQKSSSTESKGAGLGIEGVASPVNKSWADQVESSNTVPAPS